MKLKPEFASKTMFFDCGDDMYGVVFSGDCVPNPDGKFTNGSDFGGYISARENSVFSINDIEDEPSDGLTADDLQAVVNFMKDLDSTYKETKELTSVKVKSILQAHNK